MRVVLDTNILISACWKPGGLEQQVLDLGLYGSFTLVVSAAVWDEYVEVLQRPKFVKLQPRVEALLHRLRDVVLRVEPATTLDLATDPDDNRLLECAATAQAQYLITGNLKDYPLDWPGARIVNARQFFYLVQFDRFGRAVIEPVEQ